MKVITILQPWATLIALGEKQFETRSWSTRHRGQLGIHAGKQMDMSALANSEIRAALARHRITDWTLLPAGEILATCNLERCWKVSRPYGEKSLVQLDADGVSQLWGGTMPKEYHFGDYADGRYAWELADIRRINPIPVRGQQGLWNFDINEGS